MASARRAYIDGPFKDTVRLAQLDAATELARKAYERNGTVGSACTADPQPANEKGHGYNAGSTNSIQQGASGLWIQLVGGAGLNWPDVQRYLRWQQNRYRWGGIAGTGLDGGWDESYWYYLWSSFKAYQFLVDSKVVPKTGNIGVADIGTLPAADAPACAVRQVHRDPDTLPRVALFGAGPAGYYGDEEKRIYFDYAYTIMDFQCESGYYGCDSAVESVPGRWDSYAEQAYALLVLQRSVGGGCLDSDRDGICDSEDDNVVEPPVPPSGGLFCDKNLNGRVDDSDIRALGDLIAGKKSTPVTPTNAWANYVRTPASEALVIDTDDYEACIKVQGGDKKKLYY
jgi:hypothetical protein